MPVATSSMSTNAFARRQFTRQLWSNFYLAAVKVRQSMDQERNMALKAARSAAPRGHLQEQQRISIAKEHETRYYFMMRSEWDRTLRDNGLEHEDWGDITPQEMSAICAILGPPDLDADEESHQPEIEEVPQKPLSHPPIDVAPPRPGPQPLSQSLSHQSQSSVSSQYSFSSANASYGAPSMSSRSQNTSSAGYARIDPRNFTDDERNDSFGQLYGRNGSDSAVGGDEDGGILVPRYQTWDREDQQPMSAHLPNRGSINQSSPAEYSVSHSYQHQLSSSLSSVQFPSHASSLSRPAPAEFHNSDDPDRLFMPAPGHIPSSSAAAGPAPVSATAAKPKSKLRSEYIGPQLTTNDSENEADADFASMSKTDQIAAYEKFKWDVRVQKIREFHNEAAELDIELASRIDQVLNDKAATAQLIAQHAHDMSTLQHKKEEERKREVDKERSRMKDEIRKIRPSGSGQTQKKKKKGATATSTAKDHPNLETSPPAFPASSSYNAINAPPIRTVKHTPGKSSPAIPGFGAMNLDGLQSVFDSVPDVGLDTAFQISQLIQESGDVPEHQTSYDSDWNTPQPNPKHPSFPSRDSNSGARNRSESISVLGGSDSRFGNLNAKKAKQRGATATVQTPADADNAEGMFWRPQAQQASPEESRLLTDQYAQFFVGGEDPVSSVDMISASSGAADHHENDENDWVGWNKQPAPKASGAGKAKATNSGPASAWKTKKPTHAVPVPPGSSSPSMGAPGSWGAGVKKTLGFGGGNNPAVGGGGQWEAWGLEDRTSEDVAMVEREERDDLVRPSPSARHRKPSMLSDMMAKGRNVVAGAVGAALGPISMSGSSPNIPPQQFPSRPARKNSSAATTVSPPPTASSINMPTTAAGKKAAKKSRQTANRKGTPTSPTNQEGEGSHEQSIMQPHLLTPRAAASSTKFAPAFGSADSTSASNQFGFGSPTSRSGAPTGTFGGRAGNIRKPSGLHQQVWNAGEEEEHEEEGEEEEEEAEAEEGEGEEEEEEEEEEAGEQQWNMPGSLNPRGAYRPGPGSSNSRPAWGAPTAPATGKKAVAQNANNHSAWGRNSTAASASQSTPFASAAGPKKGLQHSAHTRVTMEEIPDESEDKSNRSPSDFLAVDSRYVMEPKPSKPAAAYDDIIYYGESSSPENMRHPPIATNKRSPPSQRGIDGAQDDDFYDQEWYQRAAKQLQQGTEKGTRLFGEQPISGGIKSTQPQQANSGMNIPSNGGSGPRANKSPWVTPSSIPSHVAGSISASYKDTSPLASGPPPKISSAFGNTAGASKSSSKSAWGAGKSSSPNVGVGLGKTFNAKAKPTTGTSAGFGAGGGFGWADATTTTSGGSGAGGPSHAEDDPWGQGSEQTENFWEQQKPEEEQEREEELIKSRKKLQEMFDDSSAGSKPGMKGPAKGTSGATVTAKLQRETKQREEREREQQERERLEREAMEREVERQREAREREEQEKAAEEAKVKAAVAAKPTPQSKATGGKKGKGKKK